MPEEKIASSPELAEVGGWTVDENNLSQDEVAAMHLAMGFGMSMSASARSSDDPTERHTIADISMTNNTPLVPLPALVDNKDTVGRLQPVIEDQEMSSIHSEETEEPEKIASKAASFYIGGDDGGGGGGGGGRLFSPRTSANYRSRQPSNIRESEIKEVQTITFTPPDGGYGWVVALSACFINMWIVGFIKSYGVLYVEIRNAFPEASTYHVSWLPSLLSTVGLLIGM